MADSVEQHYTRGDLQQAIVDLLQAGGKDLDQLTPADLAPVDEFHVGGRPATVDFAEQLRFPPGAHLLDVGCGLGGASRYFALDCGCRVTGIDLTEEYVRVARMLSQRIGLDGRAGYHKGSALAMPFANASFDGAYMLHVGMNVSGKPALFAEVHRVLRPGARFGVYDVMLEAEGEIAYPLPWAASAENSFLETRAGYRKLFEAAGFSVEFERGRREAAPPFFAQMRARAASGQGLSLALLMGPDAPQKVANIVANIERGLFAPVEMIGRVQPR